MALECIVSRKLIAPSKEPSRCLGRGSERYTPYNTTTPPTYISTSNINNGDKNNRNNRQPYNMDDDESSGSTISILFIAEETACEETQAQSQPLVQTLPQIQLLIQTQAHSQPLIQTLTQKIEKTKKENKKQTVRTRQWKR